MVAAIPTLWQGIRFRSRLEARWAAFFTSIGWDWSYEPIELAGYIPDFYLHLQRDVLVEVKPFMRLDDDVIEAAHEKIMESGYAIDTRDAVVVGARLFDSPETDNLIMGRMGWGDDAMLGVCSECGKVSFASDSQSYHCRMCGANPGHGPFFARIDDRKRVFGSWLDAGNQVQWKGRGA